MPFTWTKNHQKHLFSMEKITVLRKSYFSLKKRMPSTSKISFTTKSLLLTRKTNGYNFSHWKKLLCYENRFFNEKHLCRLRETFLPRRKPFYLDEKPPEIFFLTGKNYCATKIVFFFNEKHLCRLRQTFLPRLNAFYLDEKPTEIFFLT